MSAGADFSRNCLRCEHLRTERWPLRGGRGKEAVAYRCFAPGPCRGYHMGTGLILPYVPAWFPKMEREKRAEGRGDTVEKVLLGDVLENLRTLDAESIYTCVTSPPYYNLRDYGADGQIGKEKTPEEYVEKLVTVFREVRRVLRPDGTMWLNIGDSYASKTGRYTPGEEDKNACGNLSRGTPKGYKHKDLIGVPWM